MLLASVKIANIGNGVESRKEKTMSDYIDRQELIENLKKFAPEHYTGLIDDLIRKQPAADVRPVVCGIPVLKYRPQRYERYEEMGLNEKGEMLYLKRVYVDEKNYAMYCPVCGKRLCSRFTNFCPNCGADVRG